MSVPELEVLLIYYEYSTNGDSSLLNVVWLPLAKRLEFSHFVDLTRNKDQLL